VNALCFRVQSTKIPCTELLEKVETFLAGFVGVLASMPPEKFRANCIAVAVDASLADKSVGEEAGRLWSEISEPGRLVFNRASLEAEALLALTQDEVVQFFKDCVAPGGRHRRVFASLVERGAIKSSEGPNGVQNEEEEEEEGEDEDVEMKSGEVNATSGEVMELIAAPPSGELIGTAPLKKVAAALAALSGFGFGGLGSGSISRDLAATVFAEAGLKEVSDALSTKDGVLRLRVDCGVSRETVGFFLPDFPSMEVMVKVT